MKQLLHYSLCLYLLLLAIMPCTDRLSSGEILASDRGEAALCVATEGAEGAHHRDACSPFCFCSCCGLTLGSTQLRGLTLELSALEQVDESFIPTSLGVYIRRPREIWQPPKI